MVKLPRSTRDWTPRNPTTSTIELQSGASEALRYERDTKRTYRFQEDSDNPTGDYNIIVHMGARELNELSNFITSEIHRIPGVNRTETLPSFRT
ncbi:MAG: Lrp/AsnC ligand binding domain-containing protein [Thermoplasmata archaeon]